MCIATLNNNGVEQYFVNKIKLTKMTVKIMWDIWTLEGPNDKNPNDIALATESIHSRKSLSFGYLQFKQ